MTVRNVCINFTLTTNPSDMLCGTAEPFLCCKYAKSLANSEPVKGKWNKEVKLIITFSKRKTGVISHELMLLVACVGVYRSLIQKWTFPTRAAPEQYAFRVLGKHLL